MNSGTDFPPFETIDVLELLPQRPPFVLIDSLLHFDMKRTQTALTVRPDNIFVSDGRFDPCGLIENMAQTCAARIGFANKYIFHRPILIGFIGAVRKLQILRSPRIGERLTTTIDVEEEIFNMTLASARVCAADELLAECTLKIALSEQSV